MVMRHRLIALTAAVLIAGAYTVSLASDSLCSVFRSTRHLSRKPAARAASADTTAAKLAAHR